MLTTARLRELERIYRGDQERRYWPSVFDGVSSLSRAKIRAAAIPVDRLVTPGERLALGLTGDWDVPDLLRAVRRLLKVENRATVVNRDFGTRIGASCPLLWPTNVCRLIERKRGRYVFPRPGSRARDTGVTAWWIVAARGGGAAILVDEVELGPWRWVMRVRDELYAVSPIPIQEWDRQKGGVA